MKLYCSVHQRRYSGNFLKWLNTCSPTQSHTDEQAMACFLYVWGRSKCHLKPMTSSQVSLNSVSMWLLSPAQTILLKWIIRTRIFMTLDILRKLPRVVFIDFLGLNVFPFIEINKYLLSVLVYHRREQGEFNQEVFRLLIFQKPIIKSPIV